MNWDFLGHRLRDCIRSQIARGPYSAGWTNKNGPIQTRKFGITHARWGDLFIFPSSLRATKRARAKLPLLRLDGGLYSRPFNQLETIMARICAITGRRPVKGSIINRKGQSKKSGGIGTHVTSITKRKFRPNLQRIRIKTANGGTKRVWVSVKAIKAGLVEKV